MACDVIWVVYSAVAQRGIDRIVVDSRDHRDNGIRYAVTIRITHPNSCSLKYDEQDLKLREMLEASGIEPKEPEESTEA